MSLPMKRGYAFWLSILVVLFFGVLLVFAAFSLDGVVQDWQHRHALKNIGLLRRYVTRGTDWPSHVVLGLIFAGVAWRRGRQRWTRIFLAMIVAGALAGLSAYALKATTGRVRPSVNVEKGWAKQTLTLGANYQSFPSGHTAFSTAFFALLLIASWRIGLSCLPIPIFVAFSRIFLGAHYLSDVVAAIVLGVVSAMLVAHLMLGEDSDQTPSKQS
jgi:membrane-associated phospholipid phosphatase